MCGNGSCHVCVCDNMRVCVEMVLAMCVCVLTTCVYVLKWSLPCLASTSCVCVHRVCVYVQGVCVFCRICSQFFFG